MSSSVRSRWVLLALPALSVLAGAALPPAPQQTQIPATLNDFTVPGTQPGTLNVDIATSNTCSACHGNYDPTVEPYERWAATMMGQAGRDPVFYATLAIANQDVDFGGELCLRCHAPGAWLAGRSTPTNGSSLDPSLGDLDGVTCNFCHRMVDPIYTSDNPADDPAILAGINGLLEDPHSGSYIIDPDDNRRGPFDLGMFFYHEWRLSPYHRESLMCGTCHDVSNPLLEKQPNGTWALGPLDQAHPTAEKDDMFPVERTYGEWAHSVFSEAEIEMGGRFGGDKTAVATCQDCHMPDASGTGCLPGLQPPVRPDLPVHSFQGANSWVLRAIRALYPDSETGLNAQSVDTAVAANVAMLQAAADLEAVERGGDLLVRVTNMGGHKLPTGYGEGRRMWLNVRFYDGSQLLREHGEYNLQTAELTKSDTTVYEIEHGIDAGMSAATGVPVGQSFHFLLNNTTEKDNRIPARGFRADVYEAIGAYVVGAYYEDGQYWSEVPFDVPAGATRAEVRLFHQTTSKDYITFLRDENVTDNTGRDAYRLWEAFGKSEPVEMATATLDLSSGSCFAPRPLDLGKERPSGTRPELTATGSASIAGNALDLVVTGAAPGALAILFEAPHQVSEDHFGGVLNVGAGARRVAMGTTDAQGGVTFPADLTGGVSGDTRIYQVLFRDAADPVGIGLTGGLRVDLCD